MHTVTKVLVVFAAILCVLLAALTMAYSVNADRITADYQRQVQLAAAAETLASSQLLAAKEEQIVRQQTIDKLRNDATQKDTQITGLQNERQQLVVDKSKAENVSADIMSKIDQLAATNKTMALLIESYRNEVTKLREGELGYRKREIELVDRLNDLDSQREVLEASVRALQESLIEARHTIETNGGVGGNGAPIADGPIIPSFPVSAKVIDTKPDPATGKPTATINVGTNNQVREHMQLVVVRDGKYLADFIVQQADLQWSRGVIDTHNAVDDQHKPVQVRAGDVVRSLVSR